VENVVDSGAGDGNRKGQNHGNKRTSNSTKNRPNPINTAPLAPNRSTSSTSNRSATSQGVHEPTESKSAPTPRSIQTAVSSPRTAIEAAVEAATKKHSSIGGGDVFANLQKIISDMKAMPSTSGPTTATSLPGSRSTSGTKDPVTTTPSTATKSTPSPIAIPPASPGKKQLKADAPTFTPSFQPAVSPVASQAAISPASTAAPLWTQQQPGGTSAQRRVSSGSMAGPGAFGNIAQAVPAFTGGAANYYPNQLHVHPEAENEDLSPMSFSQHSDAQYQQQQLLAAQQLQFQQIQLLQAQLAAQQQQNQQHQQHQHQQSMGSFIAPRFQALAIQRAAQQAQQAQQLAQAQQLYELQQAQLLEAQRQREEAHAAAAQATLLNNPPPVFEEDSPEPAPASLGPTGRPQLAPTFTFGAKKAAEAMSPPLTIGAPVINRSEGIGGAQATGLAGLAARAHKRTGSELTPAMQQQVS
jgi:protein SSD1